MNTRFFFSFLLCATAPVWLQAQADYYYVRGKVIDQNTRAPLQAASVFAQNTVFGVATDAEGRFSLRLPAGGYSLITTFTGYETEIVRVSDHTPGNDSLVIEMKEQARSLEAVTITISNEVKDGWKKYGDFFTDHFIGRSAFAKQCVIRNPEVLRFYFYKKKNQLKVLAREPLVVENHALGYILKFTIDSFTNDYTSKVNLFIGYPLFEEMQGTEEQQAVWNRNRETAYRGSLLELMRSIYSQTLKENGFEIQFVVGDSSKEFPIRLGNIYGALNYSKDDSTGVVSFRPNQQQVAVIYLKAKPEKNYLDADTTADSKFQLSTLYFPKGETFYIEKNGFFYEQEDMTSNGYLGFKKIGDMLPYHYDPDGVYEDDTKEDQTTPPADSTNSTSLPAERSDF